VRDVAVGECVGLPDGVVLTVVAAHPHGAPDPRLWRADLAIEGAVEDYLARVGRPIRYGYVPGAHPLADYQTVFARQPGSAEMPSAARPFTTEIVTGVVTRGVVVAPLLLHTGVSSLETGEAPLPERFEVPETTARLVNLTRASGGRVVAAGTTVTRALESAADADGTVQARAGWTDLVLSPARPARVVRGLVTGWHAPGASHLRLLEAVASEALVARAYAAALRHRYLWHEFGDSCLLLP
jgi:S-adenosylmethionine:tRNA ribosyltransferase-isomerase